jgi:hypothetical protein
VTAKVTRKAHSRVIAALAFATLFVLCLGLPRLLVVCRHGPDASLELAHFSVDHRAGGCCQGHGPGHGRPHRTDHGREARLPEREPGGAPAAAPGDSCEHSSLAIELNEPPRPHRPGIPDAPPAVASLPPVPPSAPQSRDADRLPPSTGPPRTDARTALLASTVLLI